MIGRLKRVIILDIIGYVILLLLAWAYSWTVNDLAWSLWISGFAQVCIIFPVIIVGYFIEEKFRWLSFLAILTGLAFLGYWIYFVYDIYGDILNFIIPLEPDPGRVYLGSGTWRNVRAFDFAHSVTYALVQYFPAVIGTLLPQLPAIFSYLRDPLSGSRRKQVGAMMNPYLHFTVIGLGVMHMITGESAAQWNFIFTALILTICFFPWRVFYSSSVQKSKTVL